MNNQLILDFGKALRRDFGLGKTAFGDTVIYDVYSDIGRRKVVFKEGCANRRLKALAFDWLVENGGFTLESVMKAAIEKAGKECKN